MKKITLIEIEFALIKRIGREQSWMQKDENSLTGLDENPELKEECGQEFYDMIANSKKRHESKIVILERALSLIREANVL